MGIEIGTIRRLWNTCLSGRIDTLCSILKTILMDGFSANRVLTHLFDQVLSEPSINEEQRAKIISNIGFADKALLDGADEYLQIINVAATIQRIVNKKELDDD